MRSRIAAVVDDSLLRARFKYIYLNSRYTFTLFETIPHITNSSLSHVLEPYREDRGKAGGELPPPEQCIREFEEQLKRGDPKAQLCEAVLDVLEKDYGVQIVKKSSRTRPSKG